MKALVLLKSFEVINILKSFVWDIYESSCSFKMF